MVLLSSAQPSVLVRWCTQHHATDTPCRTPSTIAPRPRTWRVLQLIRASAHLLVRQLFPRTHAQLRESFACQNRVGLVDLRVIRAIKQEDYVSVPNDQQHTAHPHAPNTMYTMRIHGVDGCIANVPNTQTHHNKPSHVCYDITCRTLQNWAQTRRMVNGVIMSNTEWQHACRTKFMHTCKNDNVGKTQQILEPCAHGLDNKTVAKRKKISKKNTRQLTKMCRLLIPWVVTETNW